MEKGRRHSETEWNWPHKEGTLTRDRITRIAAGGTVKNILLIRVQEY